MLAGEGAQAPQVGLGRDHRPERVAEVPQVGVRLLDVGAQVGDDADGPLDDLPHAGVDGEVPEVGAVGHAQPGEVAGGPLRGGRGPVHVEARDGVPVTRIGTGDHRQQQGGVGHGARQGPHVLEVLPAGDPGVPLVAGPGVERYPPHGGLDPVEPAVGRGDADGPTAVAAERERRHAGRHGDGGTGARTAGRQVGVPRVARRGAHRVVPDRAVPELGNRGLPQQDRAGRTGTFHDDVVLVGHEVEVGRRTVAVADPPGGDEVLDRQRDPGQRAQALPSGQSGVHGRRLLPRGVGGQFHERVQRAVERPDAGEGRLGHLGRGHRPVADEAGHVGGRQPREVVGHRGGTAHGRSCAVVSAGWAGRRGATTGVPADAGDVSASVARRPVVRSRSRYARAPTTIPATASDRCGAR